jgi:DNA-binding MarR family transcriptional regulator
MKADEPRFDDQELRRLTMALGRIGRMLRQQRDESLSWPLASLLLTVSRLQPATPQRLAVAEGVAAPSLTRTLARLIDLGLVARTDHPDDGRMVLVSLTEAGAAERGRVVRRRAAWLSRHLSDVAPEDLRALRAALPVLEQLGWAGRQA